MAHRNRKRGKMRIRDAYFKRGIQHNRRGDYAKAVDALQKAISIDPDYADAHSNLGVAHALMKNREKAVACFEKALALAPEDASAYYKLGNAYVEAERFEEAKDITTAALEFDQDLVRVHYVLGRTYVGLQVFDKALHHFQTARDLASDIDREEVDFDFYIGHVRALSGEFDLALAHFHKSLERDGEISVVQAMISLVYLKQGKFDEAERSVAEALLLNPTCVTAHYALEKLEEAQNAANELRKE